MKNIPLITPKRKSVLREIFKDSCKRKTHPELATLTRAELDWITPKWGRTLLIELVRHGYGPIIAPLLTDTDFLSQFLDPSTTILNHLARNPFPNRYFPHHLLTPELMRPSKLEVGVFTRLVEAARNNPGEIVEHLPVFHIDSKWLTPQLLLQEDGDGMGVTNLVSLLGCGERGHALVTRMPEVKPDWLSCVMAAPSLDHSLLYRAQALSNGANVHELSALLGCYTNGHRRLKQWLAFGAPQPQTQDEVDFVMESERRLRAFVTREATTVPPL